MSGTKWHEKCLLTHSCPFHWRRSCSRVVFGCSWAIKQLLLTTQSLHTSQNVTSTLVAHKSLSAAALGSWLLALDLSFLPRSFSSASVVVSALGFVLLFFSISLCCISCIFASSWYLCWSSVCTLCQTATSTENVLVCHGLYTPVLRWQTQSKNSLAAPTPAWDLLAKGVHKKLSTCSKVMRMTSRWLLVSPKAIGCSQLTNLVTSSTVKRPTTRIKATNCSRG